MSRIKFDNPDETALFCAVESWVPVIIRAIPAILVGIVACVCTHLYNPDYLWIAVVASLFLVLVFTLPHIIDNLKTDAVVTNRRFYYRRGIIDLKDHVCDLGSVTDVTIDPSVLGRLFNYADVHIQTKAGDDDFVLCDIHNAYELRRVLNVQRDSL